MKMRAVNCSVCGIEFDSASASLVKYCTACRKVAMRLQTQKYKQSPKGKEKNKASSRKRYEQADKDKLNAYQREKNAIYRKRGFVLIDQFCSVCDTKIIASDNKSRRYCSECAVRVAQNRSREYYLKSKESADGKERRRLAVRRWIERNPEKVRDMHIAYSKSEKGILAHRCQQLAAKARHRLNDPEIYIATFKKLIVEDRVPCEECGAEGLIAHELDHVIPVVLGRLIGISNIDGEWNLQVLCKKCHRQKTNRDNSEIKRLKRKLAALEPTLVEVRND